MFAIPQLWTYLLFSIRSLKFSSKTKASSNDLLLLDYEKQLTEQQVVIQRQEDMLTNRNYKATVAQQLYITDHAIYQYKKRIGFGGSDKELRKMIYKLTIRHLAIMDSLPDGHYKINDKAAVRVKDNTVCTVVTASKYQS